MEAAPHGGLFSVSVWLSSHGRRLSRRFPDSCEAEGPALVRKYVSESSLALFTFPTTALYAVQPLTTTTSHTLASQPPTNHTPPTHLILSIRPPMSPPTPTADGSTTLLSPPGAKTPSSNAIHTFFTPRRALSTVGPNPRYGRTHPLTPEESPSRRFSKRVRLNTSKRASASPTRHLEVEPEEEEEEEELVLAPPRKHLPPTMQQKLFMRSLGGYDPRRVGYRGSSCAGSLATPTLCSTCR